MAAFDIDDAQPAGTECGIVLEIVTLIVGTSVLDGPAHGMQDTAGVQCLDPEFG